MLSIGIVGLPNVGKSTLFKALTKKQIDIQNYPFTTIDPNVGVVAVPDHRLELLTKLSGSAKTIPTAIEFLDIAGLVKGASQGEGLGNQFLANIREADAITQVVRIFDNPEILRHEDSKHAAPRSESQSDSAIGVHNKVDPVSDIETINAELLLADLETVQKRKSKTKGMDEKTKLELSALEKLETGMQKGTLAINIELTDKEEPTARELNLLTNKKFIYIFNVSESQLRRPNKTSEVGAPTEASGLKTGFTPPKELLDAVGENEYVILCNTFELLLSEASPEEQAMYLEEVGLGQSGLDTLIQKSYKALNLLTFLTTGPDETRAWTAHIGDPIPRASRAIHTDFEQKFIRADVINWQTLIDTGGWSQARIAGQLRTVGKDYIIQEGDVIEIKI